MKKIIGIVTLGITYTIILSSLLLGSSYGINDILKLIIIIIISIIDIMAPIIGKLVFGKENKSEIGFPKLILNIFIIITTIIWWVAMKYGYFTDMNFIWEEFIEEFITVCIALRVLLVITELFMLIPKKTNKGNGNEKNKNLVINPIIQLVGYIILEITFLTGTYLSFVMPIIMLIVDIIMFATNKKIINFIKLTISVILIFTIFIGLLTFLDESRLLKCVLVLGVLQIILNIIEIINVCPILRRNIKKILIITLGIIILCIICVKVNIVDVKYDIYQKKIGIEEYEGDFVRRYKKTTTIIASKDEFDNFIDDQLNLREEGIYEFYVNYYYGGKRVSKSKIYKLWPEAKAAIDKLNMYKQNIELELGIDEQFFDKYNIIYGIYYSDFSSIRNVTSVKYNRIKNKIFVEYEGPEGITNTTGYCEFFIKVDKKYNTQMEWKEQSALFSM